MTDSGRLSQFTYLFPVSSQAEQAWLASFLSILKEVPGSKAGTQQVELHPGAPSGALPVTIIKQGQGDYPQVLLETARQTELHLQIGNFYLGLGSRPESQTGQSGTQQTTATEQSARRMSMEEVAQRLQGHINGIDHTGVNLPVDKVDRPTWEKLLTNLSASAAVYRYPTGQEWPFVIPTSDAEFLDEIKQFIPGRQPCFELVYDAYTQDALLQFALLTDLTMGEAEQHFPTPFGFGIPGLEKIFRSIFVATPWQHPDVRIDIYYKNEDISNDWLTGEWLVREGGRIHAEPPLAGSQVKS